METAIEIEPHELLVVEHEEPNVPKLRTMIHELVKEAGRPELQLAYRLLKELLR